MYHEELESLVQNLKGIRRARFWMTFSENYLNHLQGARSNVGMTGIEPVEFQGQQIVPIQFLGKLLPDPASLGPLTKGKTCIGCVMKGVKDGKEKSAYIYNICDHQEPVTDELGSPGHFLYHRRARHGRRHDDAHRQMDETRRLEHGADGSRSVRWSSSTSAASLGSCRKHFGIGRLIEKDLEGAGELF